MLLMPINNDKSLAVYFHLLLKVLPQTRQKKIQQRGQNTPKCHITLTNFLKFCLLYETY